MAKKSKPLQELLEIEEIKLLKLQAKEEEIIKEKNKCISQIETYKMMINNIQFNKLSEELSNQGFTLEDIMTALKEGQLKKIISGENNENKSN